MTRHLFPLFILSACLFSVRVCGEIDAAAAPVAGPVAVVLRDGTQIEGELLKSTAGFHVLLVGSSALSLPAAEVLRISARDEIIAGSATGVSEHPLYATGGGRDASIQEHAKRLGRGIVMVKTPRGAGTGWFVNNDGCLITNCHVVQGERSISITLFEDTGKGFGKKVFKRVRIVAVSDDMDLALLRIEEPIDVDYPRFPLAASNVANVGESCFTIGNPLGLERSTSAGEISSNSRQFSGRLFLQTTAPIAPGNSGGPLLNSRGEVVGVINMGAIFMDGIGFAIPVRYLREFLDNVEAFAYDPGNPNSGMQYMEPPVTGTDGDIAFVESDFIRTGFGTDNLRLADLDGDGRSEIVCVNNNKAEIRVYAFRDTAEDRSETEDYEDVNRLNFSRFFTSQSVPVRSRIQSLAVGDINHDGRPDLVYAGDIDGLVALCQRKDGSFAEAVKIAELTVSPREESIRIHDLDGDGENDIIVLGDTMLTVFHSGSRRSSFPLNSHSRGRISAFYPADVDGDGRDDLVFAVEDRYFGLRIRLQGADGKFVEEHAVRGVLSGPLRRLGGSGDLRFVALDRGVNRIRSLAVKTGREAAAMGLPAPQLISFPVDASESGSNPAFDFADIDGRGGGELLVMDNAANEFVVCRWRKGGGVEEIRSPSPRKVAFCRVHRSRKGSAAVFCLSREDRLFGVAPISREGRISFPQPVKTAGDVQWMDLVDRLANGRRVPSLVWVEKEKSSYVVRMVDADNLAEMVHRHGVGTIDSAADVLQFANDASSPASERLDNNPERLVFSDVDGDGNSDLIVYWSYTGKETIYVGQEDGVFRPAVAEQDILADYGRHPLLVVDLEGNKSEELLQIHPEFIRHLAIDAAGRIYTKRQFNWKFDKVSQLVAVPGRGGCFLAMDGTEVKWVRFDTKTDGFATEAVWDISGIPGGGRALAGDFDGDGSVDIVAAVPGGVQVLLDRSPAFALETAVLLDHDLEGRLYWSLGTGALAGSREDQVLLFDSTKAMMEICKTEPDGGGLRQVLRHRLVEAGMLQYRGAGQALELPQSMAVGDLDGNGRTDLVLLMEDRLAVYLQ